MYVTGKVLEWVEEQGGVEEMAKRSDAKAKLIYDAADRSDVSSQSDALLLASRIDSSAMHRPKTQHTGSKQHVN